MLQLLLAPWLVLLFVAWCLWLGRALPVDAGIRILLATVLTVLTVSGLGLVLLLASHFNPLTLVFLISLCIVIVAWRALRLPRRPITPGMDRSIGWRIPILIAGVFLLFKPGEYLLGNWDPGVYRAQAGAIARTGAWKWHDSITGFVPARIRTPLYQGNDNPPYRKYPGFYLDPDSHNLWPQFFPLYPMWLALAELALQKQSVLISCFFAWLSLPLIMAIGYRLGGSLCAVAAGLLLLINPVQIWFSGFITAEILLQPLVLAGIWTWLLWHERGARFFALASGACWTAAAFTSLTAVYLAALVAAVHLLCAWKQPGKLWFFVPGLCALPAFVIQVLFFSKFYLGRPAWGALQSMIQHGWLILAALGLGTGLLLLIRRNLSLLRQHRRMLAQYAGGALVLGLILLMYGLKLSGPPDAFAVMLSKTGVLFAAAGLVWLGYERPREALFIGLVLLLFQGLFLLRPNMVELYPWAYKRMLALGLPIACLAIAFFWSRVIRLRPELPVRAIILVLALLFAARPLYRGRDFAFHRDWMGLASFIEDIQDQTGHSSLVLASRTWATPLEFRHGMQVMPLHFKKGKLNRETLDLLHWARTDGLSCLVIREEHQDIGASANLKSQRFPLRLESSELAQSRRPFAGSIKQRKLVVLVEDME